MRQITARQLDEMLKAAPGAEVRPAVIDVREPWEWNLARIAGSTHLPMGEIPSRIQEIDPSHPTVVICHHGVRSLQVVAYLQRQGYDNLHNLLGGIDAWSREVDPSVPLY